MKQKLNIYLVRHTKPLIEEGTCYGQLDCTVSDDYEKQLLKLSDYFKHKEINAIYSSPLKRCAVLSQGLSNECNLSVNYNDEFKEINFGAWEGLKWDDIPRSKIDEWNNNRLHFQFPDGESPLLFHDRVITAWSKLVASLQLTEQNQNIILVAHAGVIRSILCHHLHIPFQHSTQLTISYASISKLISQKNVDQCHFINTLLD